MANKISKNCDKKHDEPSPRRLAFFIIFFSAIAAVFLGISYCGFNEKPSPQEVAAAENKKIPQESVYPKSSNIRIASLNCYNYLSENRYVKGNYKKHWPKPKSERVAMCELVKTIRPNVLALQEIGGETQVKQFTEDLAANGIYFPYSAVLNGRDLSRRIAIISQIPIKKTLKFPEESTLVRGLLGVTLLAGEFGEITVFTVHLKSKLTRDDSDPGCKLERLREAKHIKNLISKTEEKFFILLGDFNDTEKSAPVKKFSENNFAVRLTPKDSHGKTWTYHNEKYGYTHSLDHIFVSPQLSKFVVPASAHIAEREISKRAGDHRMVFADFDIGGE